MRLLVTGGAGFIGSTFVRRHHLHAPADQVVVLDALTYAADPGALAGLDGVTVVPGDVCDADLLDRVLHDHAIEAVLHLAAESHVDRSILGPREFVRTNVVGTATLLERARAAGVRRFVHVSTDEVYGELGPDDAPFTERTPLAPRSPYSASKAAADHLVQAWFETYRFPAVITRCSNNYGPRQFPEKLIPLMVLEALADRPLPVYGDGLHRRDWIHVDDHCDGLEQVLRAGREGEVYNLGGGSERANLDVVRGILRALDKPESLIAFVADRPGHDRRYAIDAGKAARELGFAPRRGFEAALAETVAWYEANRAWWQQAASGPYRAWYERNYGRRGAP